MAASASAAAAHVSTGMFNRALVAVVFFLALVSLSCAARLPLSRQKLEVRKHLKRLNKPAVKTIEVCALSVYLVLYDVRVLGKRGKMRENGRK